MEAVNKQRTVKDPWCDGVSCKEKFVQHLKESPMSELNLEPTLRTEEFTLRSFGVFTPEMVRNRFPLWERHKQQERECELNVAVNG